MSAIPLWVAALAQFAPALAWTLVCRSHAGKPEENRYAVAALAWWVCFAVWAFRWAFEVTGGARG